MGKRRPGSRRPSFLATFAAAVLVASVFVSGTDGARVAGAATPRVPKDLFDDLAHIDRRLEKLIATVRADGTDGASTIDSIKEIHRLKKEMVKSDFDQVIYGLPFSEVFIKLDCLDGWLRSASGIIVGLHGGETQPGSEDNGRILDRLNWGKKCKERLEEEYHGVDEQPPPSTSSTSTSSTSTTSRTSTTTTAPPKPTTTTEKPTTTTTAKPTTTTAATKSVTLSFPNGGESFARGSTVKIRWNYTSANGSTVTIHLIRNGSTVNVIATSAAIGSNGQGSLSWTIPNDVAAANNYTVGIRINGTNPVVGDTSNATFTITA